jgi:hypothetical protein
VFIELRQAAPVKILKVGVGAGQSEIDVIDDARVSCTWFAWCSRHEPLGECRNGGGIALIEKCAVPLPVRP